MTPIPAMAAPRYMTVGPKLMMPSVSSTKARPASTRPTTTATIDQREMGCQVGSGATSNETSTSPARAAVSSRMRTSSARSRSTATRTTPSGFGEGWLVARVSSSAATSTASR